MSTSNYTSTTYTVSSGPSISNSSTSIGPVTNVGGNYTTISLPQAGAIIGSSGYTFSWNPPSYITQFCDHSGKKIVTLENDGSVTWHDTSKTDEAIQTFTGMLSITAEQKAQITERVKSEIFDQVFEEIYQVFKDRESISCEELRIAYESSKIFRKLQGS